MLQRRVERQQIVDYIQAILIRGYSKKDAFLEFIDANSNNPSQALAQFENRKDFLAIYTSIVQGDAHKRDIQVMRMQGKYADLIEGTLDRTKELVDSAKGEMDISKKSQVIRLATETVSGLTMIQGTPAPGVGEPARLNKSSAVI